MNDNPQWNEGHHDDIDLRDIFFKVLRHWYWYLIALAIGWFGARNYLKQYTPIYGVKTTLLIMDEWSKPRGSNDIVAQLNMGGNKILDNEMEIIKSRPLISKVVDNLGLTVSYWQEGEDRDTELYNESPVKLEVTKVGNGASFFIEPLGKGKYRVLNGAKQKIRTFAYGQKVKSAYGSFRVFRQNTRSDTATLPVIIRLQSKESALNSLTASLKVGYLNETSTVISVSMETATPAKGVDILNNLLQEYTFTTLESKNRAATNTLRFIDERLKLVSRELGDVEQNVETYRRDKNITDLSTEASLFLDRVQANDARLNEIDMNLKVLEGVEKYVKGNQVGNMAPAMLGVNDPVLTSYVSRLSELESERTELAQTVQPGNPYLQTLNTQMRNVKQAIAENLRNQKNNMLVSRNSLKAMNNRLEGNISAIPRKEREYLGIKRQAGVKESLYLLLLQKREETALIYASTVNDSQVVNPPHATPGPIRPNGQQIQNYALMVALLIPTVLIFLKEFLKITVESKKEIEANTGLKVFGEISRVPGAQAEQIIDSHSRSFVSEQVRIIRSNMQYLFTDLTASTGKTILVTSSTAGEGKTFVALNMAASLALLDKKVIIMGLDMRKPKVNDYLDVDNKTGLSNYLIGQAREVEITCATSQKNLYIAPSGPIPPNPSELLATERIAKLIAFYRNRFDYIVIDTPPVALVTDALLLAPLADATFYIVRHEKTTKQQLAAITDLIENNHFKSFNIIFNAVNYKNLPGYAYGYGYGNGSYYGSGKAGWLAKSVRKLRGTRRQGKKRKG